MRVIGLPQVHIRDLKGYVETRNKILAQKVSDGESWCKFAYLILRILMLFHMTAFNNNLLANCGGLTW